jgi:dTDP-4-amino-4,6-dideoxygalactose transaminase/predicted GNAT family N-acyltransferase
MSFSCTPEIPLFKVSMSENVPAMVAETLKSGMVSMGPKVQEFEDQLKTWFDWPWVLTISSATAGLGMAYKLLDVEDHHEIISTPLTCFATTTAILASTKNIVWADTDPNTCNIDLEDVQKKITPNTKALSFVHWGGVPIDMDRVNAIREASFLKLNTPLHIVQDCAHAFGSEWRGRKLGAMYPKGKDGYDIAVYSLQAIKQCTTGDGGVILLPNKEMYDRAKRLRWFGIDRDRRSLPGSDFRLEPDIPEAGWKNNMNDINATIGLANLPDVQNALEKARLNALFYSEQLNGLKHIGLFHTNPKALSSYWIYTIKILRGLKPEFLEYMKDQKIVVSQVHARNDKNSCLKDSITHLPQLDLLEPQIVSIPVGHWVTEDDRTRIVQAIRKFDERHTHVPHIEHLTVPDIHQYLNLLWHIYHYNGTADVTINTDGIYVIKMDNKIVATARLIIQNKLYDPIGYIEDLVVHPEWRLRGFGRDLVQELTKIALAAKCYKIVLSAKDELEEFYKSCGYTRSGVSMVIRRKDDL